MSTTSTNEPIDLACECEAWDWARTAGVSAEELRKALVAALEANAARRGSLQATGDPAQARKIEA